MIKKRAIVMFSGGLDSRLAIKIMQEQEFEVLAIFFNLPFGTGCCNIGCSFNFSQIQGINLKIFDCTKGKLFKEYLETIKSAEHGRGVGLNSCIDCRIFMLKKAKEFADKNHIELIVTGEVLGERPMSQMKKSMKIIEEETGLKGRLLRPLSAKLLAETNAEKKGVVDRNKLYNIYGRRRENQIVLAKKFNISYPLPAGGCLLCERLYCEKLKKILNKKSLNYNDIELLKIGRHFEASRIILGRDKKENDLLEKQKGIKVIPKQIGPTALIKNKKYQEKAKELIQKYSKYEIKNFEIKA